MSLEEIQEYPILTVKNVVVFPEMIRPLCFNRLQSLKALEEAVSSQRKVFVVALKNPDIPKVSEEDLYEIGVIGKILKLQQLPNGAVQALFESQERGRLLSTDLGGSYFKGRVTPLHSRESASDELPHLVEALKTEFFKHLEMGKEAVSIQWNSDIDFQDLPAGKFADTVAAHLSLSVEEQQDLLSTLDTRERTEKVYIFLQKEIKQREFENDLKSRVHEQIGKKQKEYYLNEQMKAIQEAMGEGESEAIGEFAKKIVAAQMPEKVKEIAEKELNKLKMMGNNSHEVAPIHNYLDWLTSVPWQANTTDNLTLDKAQAVLDEDHYGMEKVKERIIEYIAVAKVVGNLKGPVLCLSGPPGVGKTSLAESVAKALGRKFARISLGGIRDEAEMRGHRRTYIGAMPGKFIQTMKKVGTLNPVLLLDEVDKITQYYTGGPTAALLEILDPEQNHTFMDHYLEVEYDLSQVLFICTANDLENIPLPLKDRMEIIHLPGYTELEKIQIAQKYLIPKQMEKNGVKATQLQIDEAALLNVIRSYTREAGVRSLERVLAKIHRKAITEILKEKLDGAIVLNEEKTLDYLGTPVFQYNQIEDNHEVGMVTGLAWTSVGGETLSIEVTTMKGSGKVQLTGKLGDVMKESAQAAISYVRSNANALGIYSKVFENMDIHIHVPAGGTPKDGPSAGIALTSGIVSALTGIPVLRDVALSGEVTLRGKVLPIGGLKEKLLAAKRAHIKKALIPAENQKDLQDIPKEILQDLAVIPVKHVSEVFPVLLERLPVPVQDEELSEKESGAGVSNQNYALAHLNETSSLQPQMLEH